MVKKLLILTILVKIPLLFLQAQCPVNDSLWKRLTFLRDSAHSISTASQLSEFTNYDRVLRNCRFPYDSTRALLLQRIGAMHYRQSDLVKAMGYILSSIDVLTGTTARSRVIPKLLIADYYSLAIIYGSLGLVRDKIRALDSCELLSERWGFVDQLVLYAFYQKVQYYIGIGDYMRCITAADKCSELAMEYYKQDSKGIIERDQYVSGCLVWKVNALIELKEYKKAEYILTQKIAEYEKNIHSENMGAMYTLLAQVEVQFGNYDSAINYFQKALENNRRSGFILGCKTVLNNLGYSVYFSHFHDYKKAIATYKMALGYQNKDPNYSTDDSFENLNILANIATAYVQEGLYDSAFRNFQFAFDQIKVGIDEVGVLKSSAKDFMQSKEMRYLMDLVINKGNACKKQFDETADQDKINEAIRIYKVADQLLERIKAEQAEYESKIFWRSVTRRLYENAIEACFKSNALIEGFYFFERSRAALLSDQLNERKWVGENEILRLAELKKQIFQSRKEMIGQDSSTNEFASARKKLDLNRQELNRLNDIVRDKNPIYYQGFVDTTFFDISRIRKELLQNHVALMEIYSGDSAVYTLVITNSGIQISKISKPTYEALVFRYNSYISNATLLNREFDSFVSTSRQLYKLLFKGEALPVGRIIVSPDGQYFPLEALVTSDSKLQYFLIDHAVSYTYSARFLMYQFESSPISTQSDFVGLAPLRYPNAANLQTIPGSDASLFRIKSFFKSGNCLTGVDATKANFLKQFANHRIVQLYTHAMDSSMVGEPVIWFADSALYLSELVGEVVPITKLIVLSACQTAIGKLNEGEGIFSFSRGFAAVGVPSSITNLWSVDNVSTYKITELFYEYLSRGLPIDVALQRAKIDFLRKSSRHDSLPFYWAAPILSGKSEPLEINARPSARIAILTVAGLTVLILALLWFKRRRIF